MRSFWHTREASLRALENELRVEAQLVYEGFDILDNLVRSFISSGDSEFVFVCSITLVKARNFGQGCFSLALDGLAQESGALLRPMIECLELLAYFREEPEAVTKAFKNKLPPAEEIAKKIEGKFKDLRKYLNQHASHFSFTKKACQHLFDESASKLPLRQTQPFISKTLRNNLGILCLFLTGIAYEAANCLAYIEQLLPEVENQINGYRDRVTNLVRMHNA